MPKFVALSDEECDERIGHEGLAAATTAATKEVEEADSIEFAIGIYKLVRIVGRSNEVQIKDIKEGK